MANDPIFDYDDTAERAALNKPVYNADKARGPILKTLDRAKEVFQSSTPLKGRKPITIKNGHVELHLPFSVNGKSSIVRSAEQFATTLEAFRKRVVDGAYDEAIKLGVVNDPTAPASAPKARKPRGALSTEALEARRQKMKANGTAKVK